MWQRRGGLQGEKRGVRRSDSRAIRERFKGDSSGCAAIRVGFMRGSVRRQSDSSGGTYPFIKLRGVHVDFEGCVF